MVAIAGVVLLIVAGLVVALLQAGYFRRATNDPVAPTHEWHTRLDDTVYSGIAGGLPGGDPFVATPDVLVVRTGADSYTDAKVRAVVGLRMDDGSVAWELPLAGAVCATDLLTATGPIADETEADELLVCAGTRDTGDAAGHLLLFVEPTTGRIVADHELTAPVDSIATTPSGVVLRDDVPAPADGATPTITLRWLDDQGAQAWAADAAELSIQVAKQHGESSQPDLTHTEWSRLGDAMLVGLGTNVLVLDRAGLHVMQAADGDELKCHAVAPVSDTELICDSDLAVKVVRDATGEWAAQWTSQARLVPSATGSRMIPVALASFLDGTGAAVGTFDLATGEVRDTFARVDGYYVGMLGDQDVVVLRGSKDLFRLAEDGTSTAWHKEWDFDSSAGIGPYVAGDRIVLRDVAADTGDTAGFLVLDAADGNDVGTVQIGQDITGQYRPLSGRTMFTADYHNVRLDALP